jgi:HEAT repeat protein
MLGLFKCLAQSPRPGADQAWLEAKRLFAAPENFAALEAVYQTAKQSQHRKACLEAVSPEQEGLWRLALADRDPLLQIFALKQVKGRAGFADEARSLLSARLGMVRRAALSAWMEGAFQGSPPDLEAFLLDRDSGVRELALYYAKQTGKPDPRAVYEGALRSEKPRLIAMAIEGLASLGLWEALPPLQPLAEGGDSLLECAALRALALKKDTADRDLFWKKVLGPPTAASRIACNALRSRYASVSLDELRQLARMDGPKHHLRQARRQTGQLKTWDQVLFWLEGMASPDPDHARVCGSRLKTWIDKGSASAAELEPGQRLALREALAKVKRGFSGGQEEILRFIIG